MTKSIHSAYTRPPERPSRTASSEPCDRQPKVAHSSIPTKNSPNSSPDGERTQRRPGRPSRAPRYVELAGYLAIVALVSTFLQLSTADHTPAAAPPHLACERSEQIVDEASAAVGENLRPITTLGSGDPRLARRADDHSKAAGITWRDTATIHIAPWVTCANLHYLLRHEFAHVLQVRAYGPGVGGTGKHIDDPMVELVADEVAVRWGAIEPYYVRLYEREHRPFPPGVDQLADELLRKAGR